MSNRNRTRLEDAAEKELPVAAEEELTDLVDEHERTSWRSYATLQQVNAAAIDNAFLANLLNGAGSCCNLPQQLHVILIAALLSVIGLVATVSMFPSGGHLQGQSAPQCHGPPPESIHLAMLPIARQEGDLLPQWGSTGIHHYPGDVDEANPNVGFILHAKCPPHVLGMWVMPAQLLEAGKKFGMVVNREGSGESPWQGSPLKNGAIISGVSPNINVLSFDPREPYKYTYRSIHTFTWKWKAVSGTVQVFQDREANSSVMVDSNSFDINYGSHGVDPTQPNVSACSIETELKGYLEKFARLAEDDWATGAWKAKYAGPADPPKARPWAEYQHYVSSLDPHTIS